MKKDTKEKDEAADTEKSGRKWKPTWVSLPLILVVAFIFVMLFFGENSYVKNNEYRQRIAELKDEIKQNEDSAAYYEKRATELNTDRETLEKIAREQYGMKRPSEDVYVTDIR